MSTIRPTKKTGLSEFKIQSPKHFNSLNKKTDVNIRKKLNLSSSTISPTKKRNFDAAFPLSPSSDAASANNKIAKIAFPISPTASPKKSQGPSFRFEGTPPRFALPTYMGSLFTGMDPVVRQTEIQSLPKPDFSNFHRPQFQDAELKMPPKPVKRARTGSVISVFQKQHEALQANAFKYKVAYLGKGSYSIAYTLAGNKDPIIPGVDNSDLVLKAFHGETSGFGEKKLRTFLRNEVENYRAAKAAGLPVAEIYNADTAEQDGYLIQRKVSGKVDPLNADQRLQVSRFFDASFKKRIRMDIQLQNFCLEKEQVILVDFIEDREEDEEDIEVDLFNKKVIEESWIRAYQKAGITKDQAVDFLNELSANHYQEFVQEKLSRFA